MIYTPLTKLAMKVAFDAHKDQFDKSGIPYIYHPIHLAEQMLDEDTTTVALLHDTIEDTYLNEEKLLELGFPRHIVDAIALMTHAEGVDYMDYVKAIKENPIARKVKLADLAHNSDTTRLDKIDQKALDRVEKYKKAIELLNS